MLYVIIYYVYTLWCIVYYILRHAEYCVYWYEGMRVCVRGLWVLVYMCTSVFMSVRVCLYKRKCKSLCV